MRLRIDKAALRKFEDTLEGGFKKVGKDLRNDAKAVGAEVKKGWGNTVRIGEKVRDGFVNVAAESVGVAELAGLRYPVSQYEFKVSNTFTRGSRIDDPKGYDKLKAQGFKSIVDLTLEGTNDGKLAPKAGLNTLNVRILDNSAPSTKQMVQLLDFVSKPENQPAYVHCEAGKGRTGVATACYRMAIEGWTPDQALAEGKKYGLVLPNQTAFVRKFAAQLQAGEIPGYPK